MGEEGRSGRREVRRCRALPGLLIALLLAACGGAAAAARPVRVGADIVIGAPMSITGMLEGEGQLTQQGYLMWRDWVNGRGGIEVGGVRHQVHLLVEDDRSKPALDTTLATDMITREGAQFLLGPYGSEATARVAAVAEQYQVPFVEGTGVAQAIFDHGYRYSFCVASLTDQYMAGIMDMAAQLSPRPRTIALLSADDSFSLEVAESVKARAPGDGFQIVFSQRYPAGSTDVTALVARAAATRPDMLINSGHLAEAVAIHRAARALALDARIFAYSVGPSTPDFVAELGPDADYVFVGSQWTPQVRYQPQMYLTVAQYIAAYESAFRTLSQPSYQTASATAAALALERAIENAASTDPRAVRNALVSLDVRTFYGRLEFDGRGVDVYKPMVVQQIQRSRLHTVYPPGIADARPLYPTPAWSVRP